MESGMERMSMNNRSAPHRLLVSNVFKVRTGKIEVSRYVVTVDKIIDKNNNQPRIEISRNGGQDATRVPRARICKAAMQLVLSDPAYSDLVFLYEGCEVLLTNAVLTETAMIKRIDPAHLDIRDEDRRMHLHDASSMEVKFVPDGGMVDITAAVQQSTEEDPHLANFYAMLSRAHAPSDRFVGYRGGRLFDQQSMQDIKFGQQRVSGIVAGVRTIGEPSKMSMAVDVDVTQGTFYKPQHVIDSICDRFGIPRGRIREKYGNADGMRTIEIYIRDMVVQVEDTDRVFTICGLKWTEENGPQPRRLVAWPDVCSTTDQADKYRHSPVALEEIKTKDGRIITHNHPLEALHVLPHTKVPKEKQEAEKPRPIDADTRFREINKARRDIGIDGKTENETLKGFASEICPVAERVNYTRLEAPAVYGARPEKGREQERKRLVVDEEKRKWNPCERFIQPVSIACLRIYYDLLSFNGDNEKRQAEQFGISYVEACKMKGIEISDWIGGGVSGLTDLEHKMEQFKKDRDTETARRGDGTAPRILLMYLGDREHHDHLKLLERRCEMLTQHVEPATVLKTVKKGKGAKDFTIHNIVLKTNEKCGGRNMEVVGKPPTALSNAANDKNAPATLIIGVDVAHPPPMNRHQKLRAREPEPSMVGISSNALSANPMAFCGDYVPTEGRRESVPDDIMEKQGKYLIEKFHMSHGRLPERIVYYRDGVAKGQYHNVTSEFAALMDGAKQFVDSLSPPPSSSPFNPREVVVVCTKRHNVRLFDVISPNTPNQKAINPKAGTLVDTGIVSPFAPEFYLQAATAIIGTAKPLMCTVLKDGEKEMMMYPREDLREIELLTHDLCYTHEICDSPVSLPEPVYNAHENAKRGMNNLKSDRQSTNQRFSLDEVNDRLSTRGTLLEGIKYNA